MDPNIPSLSLFGRRRHKSCSQSWQHQAPLPAAQWNHYFQPVVCGECWQLVLMHGVRWGLIMETESEQGRPDKGRRRLSVRARVCVRVCVMLCGKAAIKSGVCRPEGHTLCSTCGFTDVGGIKWNYVRAGRLRRN